MSYFLVEFSKNAKRADCGRVDQSLVEKELVFTGWVQNQRDHGHFCFFDLKDQTGVLQIFLDLELSKKYKITSQSVIAVRGVLQKRPQGAENTKLKTGLFELRVKDIKVLSLADPLPIDLEDPKVRSSLKLKYRYLALRSAKLQKHLILRDQISAWVRQVLRGEGFLEIETPILYKTTPEGARDYLVPSRIHQGKFYSLAQSPQILKQLLMAGGLGKYFQLARCFRDEDLRSDRQPEFTQIDLEMSFADTDDVMDLNEKLLRSLWKKFKNIEIPKIKRLSYKDALEFYGSDHPDPRIQLKLKSLDSEVKKLGVQIFTKALESKGRVKSLALPAGSTLSRSAIDQLTKEVKAMGAGGLIYLARPGDGKIKSSLGLNQKILKSIFELSGGEENSLVFVLAGRENIVNTCFAFLIEQLARKLNLISPRDEFLWITEFPLFSLEEEKPAPAHHPFTAPLFEGSQEEFIQKLCLCQKDPSLIEKFNFKSKAYDLICNGSEIAGGSIRNHSASVQEALFKLLPLEDQGGGENPFEFFISALKYGVPPHGGIAWGMDRLVMILSGTDDIRDVVAFPKTLAAACLMSDAPSPAGERQLKELGLSLKKRIE